MISFPNSVNMIIKNKNRSINTDETFDLKVLTTKNDLNIEDILTLNMVLRNTKIIEIIEGLPLNDSRNLEQVI